MNAHIQLTQRQIHTVSIAALAAAKFAAQTIILSSASELDLGEVTFVEKLQSLGGILPGVNRVVRKELIRVGLSSKEARAISLLRFSGRGQDDFGVVLSVKGKEVTYNINHKRAKSTSGLHRIARSGAMFGNTSNGNSGRMSKNMFATMLHSNDIFGWGVIALSGQFPNVVVHAYDVPAGVVCSGSFTTTANLQVEDLLVSGYENLYRVYVREDGLLRANHATAGNLWERSKVLLLNNTHTTRAVIAILALLQYNQEVLTQTAETLNFAKDFEMYGTEALEIIK